MKMSIVTINYNNADGLLDTLKSLEDAKDYKKIQHVIIDGNSKDRSKKIVKEFAKNKTWIKSFFENDTGIYNAMNKGVEISDGEYIGFLNSGDCLYDKSTISLLLKFIDNNPNANGFYGDLEMINDNKKIKRSWKAGHNALWKYPLGWMPPHPMTLIQKKLINESSGFDEKLKIAADYDLMLRIFFFKKKMPIYVNKVLVQMKLGGVSNNSFTQIFKSNVEVLKSWGKLNANLIPFWIIFLKPSLKIFQKIK